MDGGNVHSMLLEYKLSKVIAKSIHLEALIRSGVVRDVSNIDINVISENSAMQIYIKIYFTNIFTLHWFNFFCYFLLTRKNYPKKKTFNKYGKIRKMGIILIRYYIIYKCNERMFVC